MDAPLLHAQSSVDQVLQQWPPASAVFIHSGAACVGCYLSRFCTLDEVASYYNLQVESLLSDLQETIQSSQIESKGVKNEAVL